MRKDRLLHGTTLLQTLICLFVVTSCEKLPVEPPRNPHDPTVGYVAPLTILDEHPNVVGSSVFLHWHGNDSTTNYFRYQLDAGNWSEWSQDTSVGFSFLDDGPHYFQVQSRYLTLIDSVEKLPRIVSFKINDVPEGITMLPRGTVLASGQSDISLKVKVKQVNGLLGARLSFKYESSKIKIDKIVPSDSSNGAYFPFTTVQDTAIFELIVSPGNAKGVTGDSVIALIKGHVLTFSNPGATYLTFIRDPGCSLVNVAGGPINIDNYGDGRIIISK